MSEKKYPVEIVPVVKEKHPNADLLSIIPVFGYTYVGRTQDWEGVTKGAYIPPDSLVDTKRPEFSFLADQCKGLGSEVRIKAKKLRGVVSFGLLVPVPDDTPLGEDWAERLGVEHYEPALATEKVRGARGFTLGGEEMEAPATWAPKYDLDNFRRYHKLFQQGEPVVVTEKLDGANARFTYRGQMYCGSRERWTREFPDYSHVSLEFLTAQGCTEEKAKQVMANLARPQKRNIWWQALRNYPGIEAFCRDNPDAVLYGEVFGDVNCIKYGLGGNAFAAFDILLDGEWQSPAFVRAMAESYKFPVVPMLNEESVVEIFPRPIVPIPYDFDTICEMAEGPTLWPGAKAGTIREGVVVSPIKERSDPHLGRCKLKVVGAAYLEKYR